MNSIIADYLQRAENWLLITTLLYFLMNGAQLFETVVLVPKWTSNPPDSLSVLQGRYAPDLKRFWVIAHSIHECSLIIAIAFCWQLHTLRLYLLILFGLHFAVRIWTLGYFAPAIMAFQKAGNNPSGIVAKSVKQWKLLNYFRVAAFVSISIAVAACYVKMRNGNFSTSNKFQYMEQRFSVITMGVDNLAAQKEFYTTKLGWQTVAENKDIVFFKLNGFLFSLFERKNLATSSGVDASGTGFRSMVISQNFASKKQVDGVYQDVKKKGITILQPPTATPFGGYYFTFADPEHNVLEVAYNPYIPLDEAGNVITHKNIDDL